MLLYLLLARLILGVDDNLVKDLEDQLKQCTNILKFTQSFYEGFPNMGNRRRLTSDGGETLDDVVMDTLSTCTSIVQSVNGFYKDLEEANGGIISDDPFEDPIILNVGDTLFSTTLATLRSKNGTFFAKMFLNESTATCSPDGTFFIDRNPETFEYILEYIRTGDMVVDNEDRDLRSQLLEDAEFYELSDEVKDYVRFSSLAGIDLSLSEVSWLNNELPSKRLGGLLFDTSKDGDAVGTFHANCDDEGPTVTIVETTLGVVFGGFTDQSWKSGGGSWASSTDAFVFRLRPAPMTKYLVSSASTSTYRHSSYGPQFGNVAFRIYNNCQDNADSYVSSSSYYDIDNYVLNNGHQDFRVKQYVVVQAVNL